MAGNFYRKVGDTVYFNGDGELVYFIPEKYFDLNVAVIRGEYIDLFGIFYYGLFSKDKIIKIALFNVPSVITCKPTSITKETNYELKDLGVPATDYRVLHFDRTGELLCSSRVPKLTSNIEIFMNLFTKGNLPNVPYDKLHEEILHNATINGGKYGVSNQALGIFVSELCRDPENERNPFRLSSMKNMTNYIPTTLIKIPKYVSAYTAITSENADEAIANAMINGSKNTQSSPMEKVMMG